MLHLRGLQEFSGLQRFSLAAAFAAFRCDTRAIPLEGRAGAGLLAPGKRVLPAAALFRLGQALPVDGDVAVVLEPHRGQPQDAVPRGNLGHAGSTACIQEELVSIASPPPARSLFVGPMDPGCPAGHAPRSRSGRGARLEWVHASGRGAPRLR